MKKALITFETDTLIIDFSTDVTTDVELTEIVELKLELDGSGFIKYKPAPVDVITHQPRLSGEVIDNKIHIEATNSEILTIIADKILVKHSSAF